MKKNQMLCLYAAMFVVLNASLSLEIFAGHEAQRLQMIRVDKTDASQLPPSFYPDHFSDTRYLVGYVNSTDLSHLPPSALLLDEQQWAVGAYDRQTFALHRRDVQGIVAGYHNYNDLTAELKALRDAYPDLVRLETAGKSVQGRELWYVIISDKENAQGHEPKFIYHANMHGDEVVGRELMIYFIRHLLENYGTDARVTQLVDHSEIFVMPSMNPDGFELKQRANARGVDINRNFPDRFTSPSDTPNGREIEVQHMMNLAKSNHFVYGINWHGGEICFNLPWGNIKNTDANKHGDDSFFHGIGREYTELNRPMYSNHYASFNHGLTYGWEWYPVNGGINDWFNYFRRSLHSVIELSVTKWPNASELPKFWNDNREAMLTYLWRGLRGFHIEVSNIDGHTVDNVTLETSASARRPLLFDSGFVHRVGPDGMYQVKISAPGYKPKTTELTSRYFDGTYTKLVLDQL